MLLLIAKITVVLILCLIAIRIIHVNSANIKQNLILVSLFFCLLLPISSILPVGVYIEKPAPLKPNYQSHINVTPLNPIDLTSHGVINIDAAQTNLSVYQYESTNLTLMFLTIWLFGILFYACKYSFQFILIKIIIKNSQSHTLDAIKNHNFDKPLKLNISKKAPVPFLFVTYNSIEIVLPQHALSWDQNTMDNIVNHELCHYQRRDHYALWLCDLISIVYWFHPLLRMLIIKHKDYMELACDRQLIKQGINAHSYAKTILSLPQNTPFNSVANMAIKPSMLKTRISAILENKVIKLGKSKKIYLAFIAMTTLVIGSINETLTYSINHLTKLISYDLPSFRSGNIEHDSIYVATFYDGEENSNTYLNLEFIEEESQQTAWLKLGPLKKFTNHIQTWQYQSSVGSTLTGNYEISGVVSDGVVDGVAIGLMYANAKNELVIHKSVGPIINGLPNMLCSWPLDIKDLSIVDATPQISVYNADTIKRLLCGSQLLKNGSYTIK